MDIVPDSDQGEDAAPAQLAALERLQVLFGTIPDRRLTAAGLIATRGKGSVWCYETAESFGNRKARVDHWRHVREIEHVIADVLNVHPTWLRGKLRVPLEADADHPVRLELPFAFAASHDHRTLLHSIIKDRLSGDWQPHWSLTETPGRVEWTMPPRPPSRVMWSDIADLMLAAPDSAPILGLDHRGEVIAVDLDSESPHILVSASTGGGKSVITRAILAQGIRRGAIATICDIKLHSHRWAFGNPAIDYRTDIGSIHDALIMLAAEGDRRNQLVFEHGDKADVGPRRFLLLEEMNATIGRLERYWTEVRTKDDPKRSPAVAALGDILFMGRAVKLHVLAVAQMATARSLGGPEMRECFATRIMSRYTMNAWKMLAPEVWPMPKASRHIGRAQVVLGGVAHETQIVFFPDDAAAAWATGGEDVTRHAEHAHQDEGAVTGHSTPARGTGGPLADRWLTVPELAAAAVVPLGEDALRKARSRRDRNGFPTGRIRPGTTWEEYAPDDIVTWYESRSPRSAPVVGEDVPESESIESSM